MNTRLTPAVIILAVLLGTIIGPFTQLKNVSADDLQSGSYWWDIAAATLSSFATSTLTVVGIVAAALGLPIMKSGKQDVEP